MAPSVDVIIIGAGACGLMAACELGKQGKSVIILEARDRVGGRIWPLSEDEFGFPAQGGAEFVHGAAPITKSLAPLAGLTLVKLSGEFWNSYGDTPAITTEFIPKHKDLFPVLRSLQHDISVGAFLEEHFAGDEYEATRRVVLRLVQGYDAADPSRISTFALRDEWLGGHEWEQYRIEEGYAPLLSYLRLICERSGCQIILNTAAREIKKTASGVVVHSGDGRQFSARKAIVTVPLPVLRDITFTPPIPEVLSLASQIGWGLVVKTLLRFKSQWWTTGVGGDLSRMDFIASNTAVPVWWSQYPRSAAVLTGWIAGPNAEKVVNATDEAIIDAALSSLEKVFGVSRDFIEKQLVCARVINWSADPYTKGGYMYSTVDSRKASTALQAPVWNVLYFAGEALYSGRETATVEGALGSGKEVAARIRF